MFNFAVIGYDYHIEMPRGCFNISIRPNNTKFYSKILNLLGSGGKVLGVYVNSPCDRVIQTLRMHIPNFDHTLCTISILIVPMISSYNQI